MKELPQRKNIRLINYDYSQSGLYFITICTKDKAMLLSNIVGDEFHPIPQIQLTPIGYEIIKTLEYIENHNDGICFDKYVIDRKSVV